MESQGEVYWKASIHNLLELSDKSLYGIPAAESENFVQQRLDYSPAAGAKIGPCLLLYPPNTAVNSTL